MEEKPVLEDKDIIIFVERPLGDSVSPMTLRAHVAEKTDILILKPSRCVYDYEIFYIRPWSCL